MHHNRAGRCLLHSPSSQSQRKNVPGVTRNSQKELLQSGPVLSSDQAVEHWVETAVGMGETHSQRKGISLGVVEGLAEGHKVKLDEHPPQGESLVRQPADEEGQDYDGDGTSNFGAFAVASSLLLRLVRAAAVGNRAAHNAPAQNEPQQEEVAYGNDDQGNYKS